MLSLFERRKKGNISIKTSLHNNLMSNYDKLTYIPTPIRKNSYSYDKNKTYEVLFSKNKDFQNKL